MTSMGKDQRTIIIGFVVGRAGKAVVIIKSVNKEGGIYRTSHAKSNRILNSDREIHIERVGGREKYFSIPC